MKKKMAFLGVMGCGVMAITGCASDLYAPCNLDPQSQNPTQSSCARAANEGQKVSCGIENFLQCDTSVCAVYEGSASYCTQVCVTDADCEEGVCRDYNIIEPGSARYCVPSELPPGQ